MCDEFTAKDNESYLKKSPRLSRRKFNKMAALAAMSGGGATVVGGCNSASKENVAAASVPYEVTEAAVNVTTPDGVANCHFAAPAKGRHPAVIVWPDIMGLRPAFEVMGRRLATNGYAVLTVNPYYRMTTGPVFHEGDSWRDEAVRSRIFGFSKALTPKTNVIDAKALSTFLDNQAQVDMARKTGTTGYCMGGAMTMRSAAALPDRIGAGASFHGGRLVTDAPDSPHRLVPQMEAAYLIAIAANDDARAPGDKTELRAAFDAAGRSAEIEVYEGAQHGWTVLDSDVYDEALAERAWARLLNLFETHLKA